MARGEFDPGRNDVKVEIEGQPFILRYNMRAYQVLQNRIGKEAFGLVLNGDPEVLQDMNVIEAVLLAGLRYHHGERPLIGGEEIMDAIDFNGASQLSGKIGEAITKSFPAAPEGGSAGPPTPTAASQDSTSTS